MENHIIGSSIDRLIEALKEKNKMNISEIAEFLKIGLREVEPILNILEENGMIEVKYPVIGEPKIILKSTAPEKLEIKPKITDEDEIKEDDKVIEKIEKPAIEERMEATTEIRGEEVKEINERVGKLESRIDSVSNEVDTTLLKEELSEILLIIAGLRDIEKISFYLKEILSIIHRMKEKRIWTNEDRDLTITMLDDISENWKDFGEIEIASLFEEIRLKIKAA